MNGSCKLSITIFKHTFKVSFESLKGNIAWLRFCLFQLWCISLCVVESYLMSTHCVRGDCKVIWIKDSQKGLSFPLSNSCFEFCHFEYSHRKGWSAAEGCICIVPNSWHIPPLGRIGIVSWRSGQELGEVALTLIRKVNLWYLLPWRGWVFTLHQWSPTFWHQDAVSWKTIFPWISGWGRWLDGFRASPSALHLLGTLFLLLLHQLHLRSSGIRSQKLGAPAFHEPSVKS